MQLKTRLKITAMVPALATLTIAAVIVVANYNVNFLIRQESSTHRISEMSLEMNSLASSYALHRHERPYRQFMMVYDQAAKLATAISFENRDLQLLLGDISESNRVMKDLLLMLVSVYAQDSSNQNKDLLREAETRLMGQLQARSRETTVNAARLTSALRDEIAATRYRVQVLLLALFVVAAAAQFMILAGMGRKILRSIRRLEKGTEIIAEGNLAYRLGMSSGDEIGRLGRAFDRMSEKLLATTVKRDELASEVDERRRAEEKINRQATILRGINRIFEDALRSRTEEVLGETCLSVAEEVTGSALGFINELGGDGLLHTLAISGSGWEACRMFDPSGQRRPPGKFAIHGVYGQVLKDGKGFFTNDPAAHPARIGLPSGHPPLEAFLGVPLFREGRIFGMLAVGNKAGGYSQEDFESLEALAPAMVEALMRKRAEQDLRASQAALSQTNEALEQKVLERTTELANMVEELRLANEGLDARATQLRALAGELTMAEQAERRRLSKILHDGLQQHLASAKMQLGGLIPRLDQIELRQAAQDVEQVIGESLQISRSLNAELSPPILHEGGLSDALQWLVRWMRDKHGLNVDLSFAEKPELPEDVKIFLFEAVRELLFNTAKHAQVSRARVDLRQADRALQITVSDEGRGFDTCQLKPGAEGSGGFGLFSIRERIGLIGGSIEIETAPAAGSRFTLTVPHGRMSALPHPMDGVCIPSDAGQDHTGSDQGTIRVLLVDDHALFRNGLGRLLQNEPGLKVVGHAGDGLEAIELAGKLRPDVILMDISMPRLNGIEATRAIHQDHPDVRIIGLSMYEDLERAKAMRDAGAVDYKTKGSAAAELIEALRSNATRKNLTTA